MFRKLLVCTDLSPASDALIQCVDDFKTIGLEEVVLAHVIYVANTPGLEEMLAEEARPGLERQWKFLTDQGMKVVVEMPFGLPARTLDEIAEKHDVSAIIIGSHGKGILQTATLGSVSVKLLNLSQRPVFLARIALLKEGKCELVCRSLFSRVLFPTDFSETAERVFSYLEKVVAETKCPVTILHVHDERTAELLLPSHMEEINKSHDRLMEPKKARLKALGSADVRADYSYGVPAREITRKVKEGKYSIVVMGSNGKGFSGELMMGSVANEVARHADVPILFVPALR